MFQIFLWLFKQNWVIILQKLRLWQKNLDWIDQKSWMSIWNIHLSLDVYFFNNNIIIIIIYYLVIFHTSNVLNSDPKAIVK